MRVQLGPIPTDAERWLPENEPDASGLGVNYADAVLKMFKKTLDDGRRMHCKRRGLKITFKIGDRSGEALMRRLDHGPDERDILNQALREAAANAGVTYAIEDGVVVLDVDESAT